MYNFPKPLGIQWFLIDAVIFPFFSRATDFKEMASKSTTNYSALPIFDFAISPFMRKGCVGDWENYFTPGQNAIVDKMIKDNLGESGLNFQYKI